MEDLSKQCPKFEWCNINLCPLDKDMDKRVELPEDSQCPLRKLTEGKRKKRREGRISPKMRGLLSSTTKKNESRAKTRGINKTL